MTDKGKKSKKRLTNGNTFGSTTNRLRFRDNGTDLKRAAWERLPGAIGEAIAARCRSHGQDRSHGRYGSRLSQCHRVYRGGMGQPWSVFAALVLAMGTSSALADAQVFDVSSGAATETLNLFARQAGVSVVYRADKIAGYETNAVEGSYPPAEALSLMLADTGLELVEGQGNAFAVQVPEEGTVPGNAQTTPGATLIAQASGNRTTTNRNSSRNDGADSVVSGTVTDARTGAGLKGALVTLKETDQTARTDELGNFRFPSVPPGEYTLRVSFLGYAGQSVLINAANGRPVAERFALVGGSDVEEIVVYGARSARAQALNLERTAENSTTVLSADLLGQFEGATLAETLRRAPGIAFQEDPLTGDGTNVIVRGLSPDFNQIRLDGQRLAEGSGLGRSPAIGNLLTDSIDTVTISKTLLPSQDSNGAGGLIEITTKGPLDRDRRFASVSAEIGTNDGFEDTQQYSGILSGTFGDNNLGLSVSLQYRDESKETVGYSYQIDAFGQYLPLAADGSVVRSSRSLDPRLHFPFEDGVDDVYPRNLRGFINDVNTETVAGTLAAQWQPFNHTDWRLSYTRTEQDVDSTRRRLSFSQSSRYLPLPIDELGDEVRGAYVWEGSRGEGQPNLPISATRTAEANFVTNVTDVLSFQGKTELNQWAFDYRLSRSDGTTDDLGYQFDYRLNGASTVDLPREFLAPEVLETTVDGRLVSLFAPRRPNDDSYVLPRLNAAGFVFFNDTSNYGLNTSDEIDFNPSSGENTRDSAFLSIRRDFRSPNLRYLELGVEYEASRFDTSLPTRIDYIPVSDLTLADLGIDTFEGDILSSVGIGTGFLSVSDADFRSLLGRLGALSSGSNPLLNAVESPTTGFSSEGAFTDEDELAVYLQGRIDIGNIEIVGGLRYSEIDVFARQFSSPALIREDGTFDFDFLERNRTLVDQRASQSEYLPRLTVNYRPSENVVVRAGYFQSVARPRISDLSGRQVPSLDLRTRYGPNGDQPRLIVRQGNPDLRPAVTHSYDLSFELYDDSAGVLGVSVFYKDIQDFIEFTSNTVTNSLDGTVLPDIPILQNLPENVFVEVRQPTNNDESAEIYGIELNVERQFVGLPGAWSGLGIYANYTYTDSEKFFVFDNFFDPVAGDFIDIEVAGVPFDQSPQKSGTFAMTYNKYGIDASIAYTAQSERLIGFGANSLSSYNDSDDSLDARFEYQFDRWNGTWRVFVAGLDLLKGTEDPDTLGYLGESKYYNSGTYFGGRSIAVGFSSVF